jgi:predicted  nucleic acid-binding Zn-ribbon protein
MKDERLYRLYKLHKVDARLIDIKNKAEHLDLGKKEAAIAKKLQEDNSEALARHKDLKSQIEELRVKNEQTEAKIAKFNKELYDGTIVSAKEVENLQKEISMLEDLAMTNALRSEELENELTPLSESVKTVMAQVEELKKRIVKKRADAEVLHKELQAAFKETGAKRAPLEAEVEPELITLYNQIRKKTGGTAMAMVTDAQRCDSCGIDIPEKVRDAIQTGRTQQCESCRRILFIHKEAAE